MVCCGLVYWCLMRVDICLLCVVRSLCVLFVVDRDVLRAACGLLFVAVCVLLAVSCSLSVAFGCLSCFWLVIAGSVCRLLLIVVC